MGRAKKCDPSSPFNTAIRSARHNKGVGYAIQHSTVTRIPPYSPSFLGREYQITSQPAGLPLAQGTWSCICEYKSNHVGLVKCGHHAGGVNHYGGCWAGGNCGVSAIRPSSLWRGSGHVYARCGSSRRRGRRAYFDELSALIWELCCFLDIPVLQCRCAWSGIVILLKCEVLPEREKYFSKLGG